MKLKKTAVLYMEGMLDKKEEEKFEKKIKKHPDILDFMLDYRQIETGLFTYFTAENPGSPARNKIDVLSRKDIEKYLKNYTGREAVSEKAFLRELDRASSSANGKNEKFGFLLNIAATLIFFIIILAAGIHISRIHQHQKIYGSIFRENFNPLDDKLILNINSSLINISNGKFRFQQSGSINMNDGLMNLLRNEGVPDEDLLLIAVALIQNEEYSLAILYLNDLLENSDKSIQYASRWYLSLIQIKKGIAKEAVHNLKLLCNENIPYSDASCKILKTLSSINID